MKSIHQGASPAASACVSLGWAAGAHQKNTGRSLLLLQGPGHQHTEDMVYCVTWIESWFLCLSCPRSLMVSSSHPALCPFPSQFSPLPNPSAFSLSLLQMSQITRLSTRRKFWTSRRMITSISHTTRLRKTPTRYEQISSADTKRVLSMVRPLQWCCVWQNQALQHRGFAPEVSQGWRVEAEGEELQRGSGWVWGRQQQRWTVK